jgi:hypothetical protein
MYKISGNKRVTALPLFAAMILLFAFSTICFAQGGRYEVSPWSFGLMADTQWTVADDPEGTNPEFVSAALAKAIEEQFIQNDVRFVIQVGDLTDQAGGIHLERSISAARIFLS